MLADGYEGKWCNWKYTYAGAEVRFKCGSVVSNKGSMTRNATLIGQSLSFLGCEWCEPFVGEGRSILTATLNITVAHNVNR